MIENTAFMGDLVLYLPDATNAFLKNNEWNMIFKWSLSFCQESVHLNSVTKKMLHLVTSYFLICFYFLKCVLLLYNSMLYTV